MDRVDMASTGCQTHNGRRTHGKAPCLTLEDAGLEAVAFLPASGRDEVGATQ